ncbi:MAG TPA: HPr family phosphocarrier protein [Casimicrobiaceae bacterium]
MLIREIEITNRYGLHARACARIVQIASRFRCDVSLVNGMRRASARSIVAVMLLAAAVGTTIRVETDGPDEMAAMTAIVSLLSDGLEQRM